MAHLLKRFFSARSQLTPQVAAEDRVYAIGDVHGRFDLMLKLLLHIRDDAEAQRDARRTRIVYLGDYIDRGDDTCSVLDAIVRLSAVNGPNLVFLRGNHEAALLAFLADPVAGRSWLDYGAIQTFASYGLQAPPAKAEELQLHACRDRLAAAMGNQIATIEKMPWYYRSGDVFFSHAGLNPTRPFDDKDAMIWGHPNFLCDDPVSGLRVVHGHYDDPEPVTTRGRICVDTGAYYSGRLTAVRLDATETFLTIGP